MRCVLYLVFVFSLVGFGCAGSSSGGDDGGGGGGAPEITVSFSATPTNGTAPLSVQFTDSSTSTAGTINSWQWDFDNDGVVDSTEQNPSFEYTVAGTYSVKLTVGDDVGNSGWLTKSNYITVTSGGSSGGGIDPSGGSGGTTQPGNIWDFSVNAGSGHVYIYIPTSYDPQSVASPVVWLFNEKLDDWYAIANANNIILVDLDEYNDWDDYVDKINALVPELETQYNVDRARYYFAGWSAGGNIAIMLTDQNQTFVAAAMVFPGSGGAPQPKPAGRPNGAKYYYAVGDQDTATGYYPGCVNEANYRASQGYTTRCDVVTGCGHYISEATYHKRQDAWNWVKDFNLTN